MGDTTTEQYELIRDSNAIRIEALESLSPAGKGSLENAFDALKILTLLENLCHEAGITAVAMLDFEGRKATMLTDIEAKYEEMKTAAEAAHARQVLMGGNSVPPPSGPRPMPRNR